MKEELDSINDHTAATPNPVFISKDTPIRDDVNFSPRFLNVLVNNRDKLSVSGLTADSPVSVLSGTSFAKQLECKTGLQLPEAGELEAIHFQVCTNIY